MIFIVAHHLFFHGGALYMNACFNKFFTLFLNPGCKIGINCFVLISGYFLCKSKYKSKKIFTFILDVFTYSVLIMLMFALTGYSQFDLKDYIHFAMPITFDEYWFATAYLGMYILYPFLNMFISSVSEQKYRCILIILGIMFSLIPTLTDNATFGIYLIHDNSLVRNVLWSNILHISDFYYKPYFALYSLASIAAVFIICMVIALIKNNTINRLIKNISIFDRYFEKLDNIINSDNM